MTILMEQNFLTIKLIVLLQYVLLKIWYIKPMIITKSSNNSTTKMFNKLNTTFALFLVTLFAFTQAANSSANSSNTTNGANSLAHLSDGNSLKVMIMALAVAIGVSVVV